jgi:DNA mismatch endonuclease, patch repair protein
MQKAMKINKKPSNDRIDPARSAQMALVRGKNTKPEIVVRRLLDDAKYKYNVHDRALPGQPDIIFPRRRKAVFVHGCFWHQHRKTTCWRSRIPKSRKHFWIPKLESNVQRDRKHLRELRRAGWKVLIVWECETTPTKYSLLSSRLQRFLRSVNT